MKTVTSECLMMSKRSKTTRVDAGRSVAEAMKQVERAMRHVKIATGGIENFDFGDGAMGSTSEDSRDSSKGTEARINKDGSIKVEKGFLGKKTSIHIHSSKNVQIGDNNVMVINQSSKPRKGRRRDDSSSDSDDSEDDIVKPTKAAPQISDICQTILTSSRLVNDHDVRRATTLIGKSWRRVGRELRLREADMEQIYAQHFREEGIQGVAHHMFTKWRQSSDKHATIGVLTSALVKVTPAVDIQVNFEP